MKAVWSMIIFLLFMGCEDTRHEALSKMSHQILRSVEIDSNRIIRFEKTLNLFSVQVICFVEQKTLQQPGTFKRIYVTRDREVFLSGDEISDSVTKKINYWYLESNGDNLGYWSLYNSISALLELKAGGYIINHLNDIDGLDAEQRKHFKDVRIHPFVRKHSRGTIELEFYTYNPRTTSIKSNHILLEKKFSWAMKIIAENVGKKERRVM